MCLGVEPLVVTLVGFTELELYINVLQHISGWACWNFCCPCSFPVSQGCVESFSSPWCGILYFQSLPVKFLASLLLA